MGIIVNKNQENDKLQARIDADLRNRVQTASTEKDPDFAEDIEYSKNLKKTGRFGWIWLVLIGIALASLAFIILL